MRKINGEMARWEGVFEAFLRRKLAGADAAHRVDHVARVVANAKRLAALEGADTAVVVPAAWLHDCVLVAKDSARRGQASRLAAERAVAFLDEVNYPAEYHEAIAHAIAAHSFSAQIPADTLAAKVVQDADRLDSLGAMGLVRCLQTGVAMGTAVYHPTDPFGETERALDDKAYSVDHFYVKLLKLGEMMQTEHGRMEAAQRTAYLRGFLTQLRTEIG